MRGRCADAEAALATSNFSAVILDVMLPDGSGIALLRAVRRAGDRTPVLLLTARDAVGDKVYACGEGRGRFLNGCQAAIGLG